MIDSYELRRRIEAEVRASVKGTKLNNERTIQVMVDAITNHRMREIEQSLTTSDGLSAL